MGTAQNQHSFAYEARTEQGVLKAGIIDADSLDHAGQLLGDRNLFVVRIASEKSRLRHLSERGHGTRREIAWMMSQLSLMLETGVHLSQALECLTRNASRPGMRRLMQSVNDSVQEGRKLSEAMEVYPRAFAPSLVALVRSGELNGTMVKVLRRCTDYLLEEVKIRKQVQFALAYPIFMFSICIGITIFLLTVVLPRFEHIFAMRGAVLPLPTRILMSLSSSVVSNALWWVPLGAMLLVAGYAALRTQRVKALRDWLVIRVPLMAMVSNPLFQARSFRTMGLLIETGVPLIDAIEVVTAVVPNAYYDRLWRRVNEHVQRGELLATPILQSSLIPEQYAQMIECGERTARLGTVFSRLADHLEHEYEQAIKTVTQFIEPAMILLMGGIVGFVVLSMMLPLFQASRVAAG